MHVFGGEGGGIKLVRCTCPFMHQQLMGRRSQSPRKRKFVVPPTPSDAGPS